MQLTDEQQQAVKHNSGHARIVAVAGAGKTATLTQYLAKRLGDGADARHLLILMYNRAAQQSFAQRLRMLCPTPTLPRVRTFHALGLNIYQRLITLGHLPATELSPLPDSAVELQLKQLLQTHTQDSGQVLQDWVSLAKQVVQWLKADLQEPSVAFAKLNLPSEHGFLLDVFREFERWRRARQRITYDDMLYDPAQVFQQDPNSREAFSNQLDEILVDEYQDINPVQHFLLQVLSGSRAKVMVIGDPDQTIYEFRGSSPQFITKTFKEDFNDPITYCLTQTFRFGHSLALAANHLISHNQTREPILTISAASTPTTRIHLAKTDDHGHKIVTAIGQLRARGAAYQGMAVLCRLWSYARPVELQLLARGIPYRIDGEQSILQCNEIRPLLHGLHLLAGTFFTWDTNTKNQALFEILTLPSLKIAHPVIRDIAREWANTIQPGRIGRSFKKALPSNLNAYQKRALTQQAKALETLDSKLSCAYKLQGYARKSEYQKRLKDSALNQGRGQEQAGTVNAFLAFLLSLKIEAATDILDYLNQIQGSQNNTALDAVTLTTIHRSKGLEWPAVFLPNLAEDHLPCFGPNERIDEHSIESERRLMYVALTRAQKQLFITIPDTQKDASLTVSRFIAEMNLDVSQAVGQAIERGDSHLTLPHTESPLVQQYLANLKARLEVQFCPPAPLVHSNNSAVPRPSSWSVGARVRHSVLGIGRILALDEQRLHIQFDNGQTRIFVSDLALPHLMPLEYT